MPRQYAASATIIGDIPIFPHHFFREHFLRRTGLVADEDVLREIADLLARPKSRSEMAGEFLREVAVLLIVFAPLEALFNPGALPWWEIAAIVAAASGVGYVRMRLEEIQK
jgi:hypothetical protein